MSKPTTAKQQRSPRALRLGTAMCDGHQRDPERCCLHPMSRAEYESHQHDDERDYFGNNVE